MRKLLFLAAYLLGAFFCMAEDAAISLLERAGKSGIAVYWDTLTSEGMLEKNGHQLAFRIGEPLVLLDNASFLLTDAPMLTEGCIKVSEKFMEAADSLFEIAQNESSFKIGAILLDPGHGGKDVGASRTYTIDGKKTVIMEKDIALTIGKSLYQKLKQAFPDKQIIMTRTTDTFVSLPERTDIANAVKLKKHEAVLYISIHVNSSFDRKAAGYEVWYLSPGYRRTVIDKSTISDDKSLFPILNSMMEEEFTTESILMSKFIMDGLQAQIGDKSKARGIKAEEWFVVRNANMPGVLIEVGFLSNQKEALNLSNPSYLQKISLGIYNGITAFVTHFERSRGFTSKK